MRPPVLLIGLLLASPAPAQELEVSGNLAGLSDLVDRGLSLSDGDPSATGTLYLDHSSGAWFGLTLARVDDLRGNDLELEASVGFTIPLSAYELDLSATLDSFHGEDGFAYPEIAARLSRDLGLLNAAVGVSYAPDGRWVVRNEHTFYAYAETEVPIPRLPWLTATAHVGRETIANAGDRTDWGAGLVAGFDRFDLSLGYEDSDAGIDIGEARIVGAFRIYF